jgi:hypothetical protein
MLREAFRYSYRRDPGPSEVNSWRNSLRAISGVFETAGLTDNGVILEYELPLSSKRLDCMILGRDSARNDQAVIIELKQWEECQEGYGDKVVTRTGGANRDVLHPSVQVGQYKLYLEDAHTAFYEDPAPVGLSACAFLHNYNYDPHDVLLSEKYRSFYEACPLFMADHTRELMGYLKDRTGQGGGMEVLRRVEKSTYRPSKKLLDHIGGILQGKNEYVLLDEQLISFERVLYAAVEGLHSRTKTIILVRGGPGTGKSVIALNLLATLSAKGFNTHYVTGSKAFTETLRQIVGRRGSQQCRQFSSYMNAEADELNVMVCDEAHRMWAKSQNRFMRREDRTDKPLIAELVHASRVVVFFIDDHQPVRPGEIGSSKYVSDFAVENKYRIFDYTLDAQFRCLGSDAFIKWVSNTLGVETDSDALWNVNSPFEFKVFGTAESLDMAIRERSNQGSKARLTAGFCWPWSKPLEDGTLVNDVNIGNFSMPWNAKPEAGHLHKTIPPSSIWAYDERGIEQIGCVYTAQGFEFDYVGVIIGPDLVYRAGLGWVGNKSASFDTVVKRSGEKFVHLVKNTYRVLLTRGLKGCYVHFMDKETEEYFRGRLTMEGGKAEPDTT